MLRFVFLSVLQRITFKPSLSREGSISSHKSPFLCPACGRSLCLQRERELHSCAGGLRARLPGSRLPFFSGQSQMTLQIVVQAEFPFQLWVLLTFPSSSLHATYQQARWTPAHVPALTHRQPEWAAAQVPAPFILQAGSVSLTASLERVTLISQMSEPGQTCPT